MAPCTTRYCRRTLVVSATLLLSILLLRASALPAQQPPNAADSPAHSSAITVRTNPASPDFPSSLDDLLTALRSEEEQSLKGVLLKLDNYARKLSLSNAQIDLVMIELEHIRVTDPYQEPWWGKVQRRTPENARLVYRNRLQAGGAIESLKCHQIADDLSRLPMNQRVGRILEYVEERTPVHVTPHRASSWFRGELWRIREDAVPFILARAREAPELRFMYTKMLSNFGDARGIGFILKTLADMPESRTPDQCDIIKRLWAFKDPRISHALVELIQYDVRITGEARYRPQQRASPAPRNEPRYTIKVYPLRKCASRALGDMSNARFSLLFCEDPKSWQTWWNSDNRQAFDPATIVRSQDELETLLDNFTYAAMDAYMSSPRWYEGSTASFMVSELRSDLINLGPQVAPILVSTYRSITEEFPVWEDDLRLWTKMLLKALDTPESRTAAKALPN